MCSQEVIQGAKQMHEALQRRGVCGLRPVRDAKDVKAFTTFLRADYMRDGVVINEETGDAHDSEVQLLLATTRRDGYGVTVRPAVKYLHLIDENLTDSRIEYNGPEQIVEHPEEFCELVRLYGGRISKH